MKTLLLSLILSISISSFSQNVTVTGQIIADNELINLGQISIYTLSDSTFIKGELLDSSIFNISFNTSKQSNFYIKISIPEYTTKIIDFELSKPINDIGIIILEKNINLETVDVVYKKATFERTMDGLSVNIEGTELQNLTNLFEILKASPQLTSPDDESIEIIGKGNPLILIDRQTIISNEELKAVPASQIERIEIITHPSAKYKAQGSSGGVIEVYTKDFHLEGYNINISTSAGINTELKPVGRLNLGISLKKKKFSLNGSLSGSYRSQNSYGTENAEATDGSNRETVSNFTTTGYNIWQYYNLKSAFDINEKQRLTIGVNGYGGNGNTTGETSTTYIIADDSISYRNSISPYKYTWLNNTAFINYTIETDTFNSAFEINLNYINNVNNNSSESSSKFKNYLDASDSRFDIKTISKDVPNLGELRVNYDHYFDTTKWKLSFGGLINTLFNGKTFDQLELNQNEWIINPTYSNSYNYNEYGGALFIELSKKWEKIGFKAGIRGEYTKLRGYSSSLNKEFIDSSYVLPFPNLSILFEPNDKVGITLFYNSGIDRPQFSNFDPFIRTQDSLSIVYGNPYLLPSFEHSMGIEVDLFYKYNISLTYNHASKPTSELSFIKNGSFVQETTPWNALKEQGTEASLSLPIETKWLKGWNSLWIDYSKYTFTSEFEREPLYNLTYGIHSYLNFTLPKSWTISNRIRINKWGSANGTNSATLNWGMRFTKKFMANKLHIFFDVNNIAPQKNKYTKISGNYNYTSNSQRSFTSFKLGLYFKFGRLKANTTIKESSSKQSDRL
jgi:hypothetical protein